MRLAGCRASGKARAGSSTAVANDEPKVDLSMIAGKAGEIGKMSIEDVMLALDVVKGSAKRGAVLFTSQGCMACHILPEIETQPTHIKAPRREGPIQSADEGATR